MKVRVSNGLITILNVLTLVCSFLAIGYSLWFTTHTGTLCQRVIQKPLLYLGLALFVVSLLGIIGSWWRFSCVLYVYLIVMFLLVVGLIAFTAFSLIVTNKGVGKSISGKGYKEYRLGDYSNWLQKYVVNGKNWRQIKSCLADVRVCSSLSGVKNAQEFDKLPLPALQSGCCKPPSDCGFEFRNATYWIAPEKGAPKEADSDCRTWSNKQNQLCFDCNSCKAGVLNNIKREWRLLTIINICITILVIIVYSVGCCALRNNRKDNYYDKLNKPTTTTTATA